jgi:hypothetical protein
MMNDERTIEVQEWQGPDGGRWYLIERTDDPLLAAGQVLTRQQVDRLSREPNCDVRVTTLEVSEN